MEHLASYGYIIFSLNHTYETTLTVINEKLAIPYSANQLDAFMSNVYRTLYLQREMGRSIGKTEFVQVAQELFDKSNVINISQHVWTDDVLFVINQFDRINAQHPIFHSGINLNLIGVMGMSFGGSTALNAMLQDSRILAGINFDGAISGPMLKGQRLERPFLFAFDNSEKRFSAHLLELFADNSSILQFEGVEHLNFSDYALYSPLFRLSEWIGEQGSLDVLLGINRYTKAYFDFHLMGIDSELLNESHQIKPFIRYRRNNYSKQF
jgi:hypothetical protein